MALSISWSDYPFISLKRYIKTFGMFIMVLVIVTETKPSVAIFHVFRNCYIFLVLSSAFLIFFLPSEGISASYWIGITSHKNQLGELSCIGAIVFIWELKKIGFNKKSYKYIFLLIISLILLFNSNSMTSVVVFLFTVSLFVLLQVKMNSRFVSSFIIFFYILAVSTFIFIDNSLPGGLVAEFFSAIGRDMTFTGRNELWVDVLKIVDKNNSWFGLGYESFWIGDIHNLWNIYIWKPNQAHNGYVDTYATLGIIGLILLVLVALNTFFRISRQFTINYYLSSVRMIILLAIVWYNFSESSFCTSATSLWFIFLIINANYGTNAIFDIEQHSAKNVRCKFN
jgi:O-antigen ligase